MTAESRPNYRLPMTFNSRSGVQRTLDYVAADYQDKLASNPHWKRHNPFLNVIYTFKLAELGVMLRHSLPSRTPDSSPFDTPESDVNSLLNQPNYPREDLTD